MAKEDEQDAHPGWGPDDRTVQVWPRCLSRCDRTEEGCVCVVGSGLRKGVCVVGSCRHGSLDEREPSPQHGSQRGQHTPSELVEIVSIAHEADAARVGSDLEEDVVDQHASGLRQGKSIGSLDQVSTHPLTSPELCSCPDVQTS
eukprot:3791852-Rhodomonas_salina.1